MPALGNGESESTRRAVSAYPTYNKNMLLNIVILLVFIFLFNNLFFQDYRLEEIKQLRASGVSTDEIKAFIPQTIRERREAEEDKKNEMERLKDDVVYLKEEVKRLSRLLEKDSAKNSSLGDSLDAIKLPEDSKLETYSDTERNLKNGKNVTDKAVR
mmetsp:Transcript_2032/g.3117  ORF Transcript_2032/g.3117 Transcript_2032/m.3117 type:complete len:157 (-) Transcript_2032:954-1424(-)